MKEHRNFTRVDPITPCRNEIEDLSKVCSYNSQAREATQVLLLDKHIKKLWYTYTMKYCVTTKNEILPFVTAWMDAQ